MSKNIKTKAFRSYIWSVLVVFLIIGWFYPIVGFAALVCMAAPVVVAAIRGKRSWCAHFCPRGIFSDVILSKISRKVKAPAFLRSTWFKILFLIFLLGNMVWGLANASTLGEAGMVFVRLVSITTAVAIVLGYVYHQRTWCGFCPMGFLASLTIRLRKIWGITGKQKSVHDIT